MGRFVLPRLQDFFFVVLLAGALLSGSRMLNVDSDLGRHLTLGQYILASHEIPTHDVLSFTKTGEFRPPYEWLAQVLFATAYRLLDLDGVVLLTSLVIAVSFTVIYGDSVERSNAPILALFLAALSAAASSLHWVARPHVFSFLFFAIWLWKLEMLRRNERVGLWQFPALMLIWANTHGGFIFGFLACGAYLTGWLFDYLRKSGSRLMGKRLLLIAAASLAASILTPDLWRNWNAVLNNRSAYILSRTAETMPPDFSSPAIWPFIALLILVLLLALRLKKQIAASHIFLLGGLCLLSLLMARSIPFFAIAAAPVVAAWLATPLRGLTAWTSIEEAFAGIDKALRGYVWAALALLLAVGFFVYREGKTQTSLYEFSPRVFPVGAVDWVDSHPDLGHMFNEFNWGGYMLYRLWPEQRVFIDSQTDFYGEKFTRQYAEILGGDANWEAELRQYQVDWIIVPPGTGLAEKARASSNWEVGYEDPLAIIFVRK